MITSHTSKERKGSDYRNLSPFCAEYDIPCLKTSDINDEECKLFVRSLEAEYIFILGWSQIFDTELISLAKVYGSHPSKLPYGAGRAPIVWTVLEKLTSSALSIFEVTEQVDAGRIVFQSNFDIPVNSTSYDVYHLATQHMKVGFLKLYDDICSGKVTPVPQDKASRSVRARRTPYDGKLDFSKTADSIDLLIRAAGDPFPGAYSFFNGEKVIIWSSTPADASIHKGCNGQILKKENSRLLVQCGDKPLWLHDFSNSGGDKLELSYFQLGARFGVKLEEEVLLLRQKVNHLQELLNEHGIF